MKNTMENGTYLMKKLVDSKKFEVVSAHHILPVLAVKLKGKPNYNVFELAAKLREKGWITPAYTLPPNAQKVEVFRIVARENFSRAMADSVFDDIMEACDFLSKSGKRPEPRKLENVRHKGHTHKIC